MIRIAGNGLNHPIPALLCSLFRPIEPFLKFVERYFTGKAEIAFFDGLPAPIVEFLLVDTTSALLSGHAALCLFVCFEYGVGLKLRCADAGSADFAARFSLVRHDTGAVFAV